MNQARTSSTILYIIDGLEFGGGERGFLQLISNLQDSFSILVASSPKGEFADRLKMKGIKLFPIDMKRRNLLRAILELKCIIQKNKVAIVHSQGARSDFITRIAGRFARVPFVVNTIQMPVDGFNVNPLQKVFYRILDHLTERYVDRFIVVSDALKKLMVERRGINPDKVARIYNGIETDQYRELPEASAIRKEFDISLNTYLIGGIGRLVWQKGFEYMIKAMPMIIKKVPQTMFIIVGDGPLREKLETLGAELKVKDNLIFTGFRDDVKVILSTIDVLVVPSLLEGFPMITLEAMSMHKPIVATQIGGITEQIVDNENGILIWPEDSALLAEAVIRVLSDPGKFKSMGMKARDSVEKKFSIDKMIKETKQVYADFMG